MYSLVRSTAARKWFFGVRCLTLSLPACANSIAAFWKGQVEAFLQLVEAFDCAVVRDRSVAARDVGGDDEPDLLAHMVEGQHLVEEEETCVGNAQLVFGARGQALDLAHGIVGEVADGAGGEGRQAGEARRLVAAERVAEHGEDVALCTRGFTAFGDGDFAAARDDALEGGESDEGVTAHLFAALDGFEEEALALAPGGAQEGRNRSFEVSHERAANRHESVRSGQFTKLFEAGMNGVG